MTHEDKINAFIPLAEEIANQRVKALKKVSEKRPHGADGGKFTWDYFTQFFHEEMNRLVGRWPQEGREL